MEKEIPFCLEARVASNEDPLKIGRVRVVIPGMFTQDSPSPWVRPITVGSANFKNGIYWVPYVGSDVIVFPVNGDIADLVYLGSSWRYSESEQQAQTPPNTSNQVEATDAVSIHHNGYRISIDKIPGEGGQVLERMTLSYLPPNRPDLTEKDATFITIFGDLSAIQIRASRLDIDADFINIRSTAGEFPLMSVGGESTNRVFLPSSKPI